MNLQRKLAAAGLAAGLVGGTAAGAILGTSGLSEAASSAVLQDDTTTTQPDGTTESDRPDPDGFLSEALAPLVEDGTITQAQADAVIGALREARPERGPGGPGGGRHAGAHLGGETVADALGISVDELREALQGGSTIAEIAEQQGVDVQVVIDALVAEAREHLDEHVAEGEITQEEADERLAELTERLTTAVEEGPGDFGGHRGPHGGPFAEDGPAGGSEGEGS